MWVAECSTYEKAIGKRRPVLVHLFFGDTRLGALAVMKAHSVSDKFFRDCTEKGKYLTIDCWTECNVYERP